MVSGWYIGGPEVAAFEEQFATYTQAAHCVGVANGLDALHLALRALGSDRATRSSLASNSYIATVLAVSMVGATPVMVEPDPATHNLDAERVEQAVTPRTRAILPTHLYGQPADLDPMLEICQRRNLFSSSRMRRRPMAPVTRGVRLARMAMPCAGASTRARISARSGTAVRSPPTTPTLPTASGPSAITASRQRYVNDVRGVNSRLDPLQAATLGVKLTHLDAWNERRRATANLYLDKLAGTNLILPAVPDWADPAWHLFVVRSPERDRLQARLAEAGIQTLIHYPIPPHRQQAYADMDLAPGSLPIAERLAGEVLSLPIGPQLSLDHADQVVEAVRRAAAA